MVSSFCLLLALVFNIDNANQNINCNMTWMNSNHARELSHIFLINLDNDNMDLVIGVPSTGLKSIWKELFRELEMYFLLTATVV